MSEYTIPSFLTHYRMYWKENNPVVAVGLSKYSRTEWRYKDFERQIHRVRLLLQRRGLKKGDRMMVCAPNSPSYLLLYLAAAYSGIVLVPIDVNSPTNFVKNIARITKPKLYYRSIIKPSLGIAKIDELLIEDVVRDSTDLPHDALEDPLLLPADILEIVFTSGSTGDPKGVVLTHGNVASNANNLLKTWHIKQGHVLLSIIPLSHMFEQTVGTLVPYAIGSCIVYPVSIKPNALQQALNQEHITTIIGVPALLQMLEHKIRQAAKKSGKAKTLNRLLALGSDLPQPIRRLIFKKVHSSLGGKLRIIAVGGAPVPSSLETFWNGLGMDVLQGYGLTETSPIASMNLPNVKKVGSLGRSLPNQEIAIASDGEILLKGSNVFDGYFNKPKLTKESFSNGWYKTGDIGAIDEDGFLFMKGRKKNMIVSGSGLNVYPEDIETIILEDRRVRDCVIIAADIAESLQLMCILLLHEAEKVPDTHTFLRTVNQKLASHQQINLLEHWPDPDFPRTPTRKIKRQEITDHYKNIASDSADSKQSVINDDPLIKAIAVIAGKSEDDLKESSEFVSNLGFDSIKRLELLSRLEDEYLVALEEGVISTKTTIGDLRVSIKAAQLNPIATPVTTPLGQHLIIRSLLQIPLLSLVKFFQRLSIKPDPYHPLQRPVLYAVNHTSHFDTFTLIRALPRQYRHKLCVAAAKDYFFKNWFTKNLMKLGLNAIAIDRSGSVQESLVALGRQTAIGNSILLYPEGTRSKTGELQDFQAGIGLIASTLMLPIVPVKITGNFTILPKGRRWPKIGQAHICFGQPIYPSIINSPTDISAIVQREVEIL